MNSNQHALAVGLGGRAQPPRVVVDVYIPDHGRDPRTAFDAGYWVTEVLTACVTTVGGATVLPRALGAWGAVVEHTIVVRASVLPAQLVMLGQALAPILRAFQSKTDQDTVLVTVDGQWVTL